MTDRTSLNLDSLAPFVGQTRADWRYLVEKGLRGTEFESLTQLTEDGLTRGPLMTLSERPSAPAAIMRNDAPLLAGRDWHICAPVRDMDLAFANEQLLRDLKGGASAARITLGEHGIPVTRAADLERLFEQVHTDLIPLKFREATLAQIDAIFETPRLKTAHVNLGLNILTHKDELPDIISRCPDNWRALTVCAARTHEAGGTDVLELAGLAATVVHAMKTLGAETAHSHMSLEIATTADAHLGVAKLRAARRIYARIAQSFGLTDLTVPLAAISSKRIMQSVDPWTNMLRTMSAGFGAVVGGADYVTLLPFTEALGAPTPFGLRIARNMQLMMMEESRLGTVADPAHGSYFHEHMTDELSKAAWTKFQSIEAAGGIETYHSSGAFEDDMKLAKAARTKREDPIVGVNLHRVENLRVAKTRPSKQGATS